MSHLAAIAAIGVLSLAAAGQAAQPDLEITGAWVFNPDLSSSPESLTRARVEGPPSGGFGGTGMSGSGGRASDDERRRGQAVARRLRDAPQRLTISRDGPRFTFTDEGGRSWNLTADGKEQTRLTGDGEIEVKARLDGPRLIVDEDFDGPARLSYTYSISAEDGVRRLSVVVRVEGSRGGARRLEMRRLYDSAG